MIFFFYIETMCCHYVDSKGLELILRNLFVFFVSLCNALNFTAHNGGSLLHYAQKFAV